MVAIQTFYLEEGKLKRVPKSLRRFIPPDLWIFKFCRETGYKVLPDDVRKMSPRDIRWLMAERTAHESFVEEASRRAREK